MDTDQELPVSRSDVMDVYQLHLSRLPESEGVVQYWIDTCSTVEALHAAIRESDEAILLRSAKDIAVPGIPILFHRTKFGFFQPIDVTRTRMLRDYVIYDYEAEETAAIVANLTNGCGAVDLGARYGWFTGVMAAAVGSEGSVYAFEPTDTAAFTEKMIEVNHFTCVRLIEKAASDEAGFISFDEETASFAEGGSLRIETVRLDDELAQRTQPIRLMKIDIEGAEHKALRGSQGLITTDRPMILMEVNDSHQRRVSGVSGIEPVHLLNRAGYGTKFLDGKPMPDRYLEEKIKDGVIFNVLMTPE